MKLISVFAMGLLFIGKLTVFSQSFINLNFEQAVIVTDSGGFGIVASKALPGWTAYIDATSQQTIFYNDISLGAAAVTLQGTNGFIVPFQGLYSVGLQSSDPGSQSMAAIAQIGQIPQNTLSLRFYASQAATLQVTFAGQIIPLSQVGSTSSYDILGGDISAFAGQSGELRFSSGIGPAGHGGGGFFDNIQFSTQAIPEPSVIGLSILGGLFFAWRRWKAKAL